ncbi:MAG: phosphoribosylanthranilate isomerase, partial [Waterburya sp.]
PDNITDALSRLQPDGIDLSSGVERSPGDKDLNKVVQLFQNLK